MMWTVLEHPKFARERMRLPVEVVDKLLGIATAIRETGPRLGRPWVDTLKASKHPNMKEIRFQHGGVWRFAFAFDPERQAVILVGGNKEGVNEARFYRTLIRVADARFDEWLDARNE